MSSNLGNKKIMAENIKRYMEQKGVNATDVCNALHFPAPTFCDWVHGRTYPRIDKIEMMANYFGITKPDLIEPKAEQPTDTISGLTQEEYELLMAFRKVSEADRKKAIGMVQLLAEV